MRNRDYIKCINCESLVLFNSEYMILCPDCGKKLTNSYSEWLKHNPDGSLQRYKSQVCVSSLAIDGIQSQRKITKTIRRTRSAKRLGVSLSASLVLIIGVLLGLWFMRDMFSERSVRSILNDKWRLNYYENIETTLSFPHILHTIIDTSYNTPDTTTNIKSIVVRQWVKPGVCNVTAMQLIYQNNDIDLNTSSSHVLQSIIQTNHMEAFRFIPSDYTLGRAKARMFSGSYLIKAKPHEFRAVMVQQKPYTWYFMITYPQSMPEGTLLAEKFFAKIQL